MTSSPCLRSRAPEDCYCIPSGFYAVGSSGHTNSTLVTGTDSTGTAYAGLIVSDVYAPTNQTFQQFWFLRDGETGLHAFSHLAYYNATTPFLRNLQELRYAAPLMLGRGALLTAGGTKNSVSAEHTAVDPFINQLPRLGAIALCRRRCQGGRCPRCDLVARQYPERPVLHRGTSLAKPYLTQCFSHE